METPPFCINKTNLLTDFKFIEVSSIPRHTPEFEGGFFTIIVTSKNGHKPDHFSGFIQVNDQKGILVETQLYPHKRAHGAVAFQFLVSANCVVYSSFKLVEQRFVIEDNPTTYQLQLGDFINAK